MAENAELHVVAHDTKMSFFAIYIIQKIIISLISLTLALKNTTTDCHNHDKYGISDS